MIYKFRTWTGPTQAKSATKQLGKLGIDVFLVGTEHVYVAFDGNTAIDAEINLRHCIRHGLGETNWLAQPGIWHTVPGFVHM